MSTELVSVEERIKNRLATSMEQNTAVYVMLRLWDFRVVAVCLFASCLLLQLPHAGEIGLFILLSGIFGLFVFLLKPNTIVTSAMVILLKARTIFRTARISIPLFAAARKAARIKQLLTSFGLDNRRKIFFFLFTIAAWLMSFFIYYSIFKSLHKDISAVSTVFLVTGVSLISILPLQTIGGLGLNEAGLTGLLMFSGHDAAAAAALGVSVNLLHLVLSVILPIPFVLLLRYKPASSFSPK